MMCVGVLLFDCLFRTKHRAKQTKSYCFLTLFFFDFSDGDTHTHNRLLRDRVFLLLSDLLNDQEREKES